MQPTAIDIPLGKLDTRTDPMLLPPGDMSICENYSSQTNGIYRARPGYQNLPDPVTGLTRVLTHKNELCVVAERSAATTVSAAARLESWNETHEAWQPKGNLHEAIITREPAIRVQGDDVVSSDIARANGLIVIAAEADTMGGTFLQVIDESTGNVLISNYSVTDGDFAIQKPGLVSCGTTVVLTGILATSDATKFDLVSYRIDTTIAPGTTGWISAKHTINAASLLHGRVYDSCGVSATLFAVAQDYDDGSDPAQINVKLIRVSDWAVIASFGYDFAGAGVSLGADGGIGIFCSASTELIWVGWFNSVMGATFGVQWVGLSAADLSVVAAVTSEETKPNVARNVVFARLTATTSLILYDKLSDGATFLRDQVRLNPDSNHLQLNLASKTWVYKNRVYYLARYDANGGEAAGSVTPVQPTFFVMDAGVDLAQVSPQSTGLQRHAAMVMYRTAGPIVRNLRGHLGHVVDNGDGTFSMTCAISLKYLANSRPNTAVDRVDVSYVDTRRFAPTFANGSTMLLGGMGELYDGQDTVDVNFPYFPETPTATPQAGAGLAIGTYKYILTFERTDAAGNTHISTTSIPASATTDDTHAASILLEKIFSLNLDPINSANADVGKPAVKIGIYRTQANQSTYYKVTELVGTRESMAAQSYSDTMTDDILSTHVPLYTLGGSVLDHEPMQSIEHMVLHQNAIWYVPSEDKTALWYSPPMVPSQAVSFSSILLVRVDVGGDITGIASLDDRLLIFKADRIYQISGTGASQTGQGSSLTAPSLMSSDCGCIDARSIITVPQGVFFKSSKGLYMVTRGNEVAYVGGPVDRYVTQWPTCTSATMLPDRREVRLTVRDPVDPVISPLAHVLIYNYEADRWSTAKVTAGGWQADSAALWKGCHVLGRNSDGQIITETPNAFVDPDGSYIERTFELGWIKPAGTQGLVRVQYVLFASEWLSPHATEIQVGRNYDVTYTMSTVWGSDTLALFNNSDQVSYNLPQQQGEAFRIKVRDFADALIASEDFGEGCLARFVTVMAIAKRGSMEKFMQAVQKG